MNPPCAKCSKTVYPMEKLNCLDKIWHKGCFRCETCNLKLTMKTYKGFDKLPYCNTHYPTTKFTSVSDTPENIRLAKQTKTQSELSYRGGKEEALKQFTQVSDSVSDRQAAQQQRMASNVGYQSAPHEIERQPPPPQPAAAKFQPPAAKFQPPAAKFQPPPPKMPAREPDPPAVPPASGHRYYAVYDYAAADDDEISFNEGDEIVDVTVIDDGWMEGRVKRTGNYGMLPSNYVDKK